MRRIGYLDFNNKNDSLIAQAFTSALANLIYHKFANTDEEKEFIDVIKKTLDYFSKYADKYENENTTYKNHPDRIEFEKKHSENRFKEIKEKCERMKIPIPKNNMSADEFQQYYNEKINEMINSQLEAEEARKSDPKVEIDGAEEILDTIDDLKNELNEADSIIDEMSEEDFE